MPRCVRGRADVRAQWPWIADDEVMRESRWFPGQESEQRYDHGGWLLADGQRWDCESEGGADLTSLRVHAPRTLSLEFRRVGLGSRVLDFASLTDLQVDADLQWEGESESGWEVLGTSMLVAARPRADELVVYVLELPQGLLCFASAVGAWRAPRNDASGPT